LASPEDKNWFPWFRFYGPEKAVLDKSWKMPDIEESLLKAGTPAPDFELAALDGSKLKLSGFRGQIVWLNKWRCG